MARERLQKILAHAGLASRRSAEALISAGKVRVNGVVVSELGASADPRRDKIEVEGKRIVLEKPVYYVLHKPRGMVTTLSDPEGRPHLGEVLKKIEERVYPVGRLDFHTSGVLLVTNDGELTEALLHPRKDVPKIYVAKLRGFVHVEELDKLRNGVTLDDGHKTKKAEVFVLREEERNTWVQITLHEGKNRQIHRMGEAIGHPVLRLARVSFAGITAEGLRPGDWRELEARELDKLKKAYITPLRQSKDRELEQAMRAAAKRANPNIAPEVTKAIVDADEEDEPEAPIAIEKPKRKPPAAPRAADKARGTWAQPREVAPRETSSEREPSVTPARRGSKANEPRVTAGAARGAAARPSAARGGASSPEESSKKSFADSRGGAPASRGGGPSSGARGGASRDAGPRGGGSSRDAGAPGGASRGASSEPRGGAPSRGSEPRGGASRGASSESRGGSRGGASFEPREGGESRGGGSRGSSSKSREGSRGGASYEPRGGASRGASSPSRGGAASRDSEPRGGGSRGGSSEMRGGGSRGASYEPRGGAASRGGSSESRGSGPRKPYDESRGGSSESRGSSSRGSSAQRPSGSRANRASEPREMRGNASAPRGGKPRADRDSDAKPRTPRTRRS